MSLVEITYNQTSVVSYSPFVSVNYVKRSYKLHFFLAHNVENQALKSNLVHERVN